MATTTERSSIWTPEVRQKNCPLPADLAPLFTDTTYGNDVCPSYMTTDDHLMIWMHDADTWRDMGGIDGPPQFQIHYNPTGDVYGESDESLVHSFACANWDETLKKVRTLLNIPTAEAN